MADGQTTNYQFVLPEVDGSDDTWGDKLNQNWTEADGVLNTLDQGLNGLSQDITSVEQDITSVEQDVSTLQGRSLTAGNGLTGGGNLTANRTFTLGTPGTLSGGTSNGVTASSHTHAINSTASRTSTSTSALLQAKAMNDHRESGDHDNRYTRSAQFNVGDLNNIPAEFRVDSVSQSSNAPFDWGSVITMGRLPNRRTQIAIDDSASGNEARLFIRTEGVSGFGAWLEVLRDGQPGNGSELANLNASNLSSGTVADARLPSTAVRTSRTITAGNGLSGGGNLSANRTITLGTPGSITSTSTNSVTATSHTHSISEGTIRSLISEGSVGAVGTYAFLRSSGSRSPGSIAPGSALRYASTSGYSQGAGSYPSGTWICMGWGNGANSTVWLRIS